MQNTCAGLQAFLPEDLYAALLAARDAYRADRGVTEACDAADELFHEREYELMQRLEEYAKTPEA